VGIMAAKTLAWSLSIPLFAVPTFVAIAQRVPADAPTVEVIADALKGKVFCERLHRTGPATWESVEPRAILAFDDWLARVGDGAIVTGPGTTTYEPRLPATLARTAVESREADPSSLLELVRADAERWRSDLWTLEPLYMRGSYAEEAKRG